MIPVVDARSAKAREVLGMEYDPIVPYWVYSWIVYRPDWVYSGRPYKGVYIGMTSQGLLVRVRQHLLSAKRGSKTDFHRKIREASIMPGGQLRLANLIPCWSYEEAMEVEEEEVGADFSLKLNMIPGGFAGIKYLHNLGFNCPRQPEERDRFVEENYARIAAVKREIEDWDRELANRGMGTEGARKVRRLGQQGLDHIAISELLGYRPEAVRRCLIRQTFKRISE